MEEQEILKKLKNYNQNDIFFLKKQWREWLDNGEYHKFIQLKGINIQVVYDIFYESKIKKARRAKYNSNRYSIVLYHSNFYDIEVIFKFDVPKKGNIGIITFTKYKIRQQH